MKKEFANYLLRGCAAPSPDQSETGRPRPAGDSNALLASLLNAENSRKGAKIVDMV